MDEPGEHDSHNNHNDHHRMMIRDFRRRFYITLVLMIPVLGMAELIQEALGYSLSFPSDGYVVFGLSTVIFLYGGWPFLSGLVQELKVKTPGMMTLIGLAISVAYVYSSAVTFGLEGSPFYWELATLIAIMLAGHWIEMASVLGASSALEKLAQLMPSEAHRKTDDGVEDVSLSEINKGDILVIKPGEKIPSDGLVIEGSSYLDESMLTGESKPVGKEARDEVIGGSVNGDGSLEVWVEHSGDDSYLSKVIAMVRDAQAAKSRTQALSDRAAFWITIISITVGLTTLVSWLLLGQDLQFSIARMATVMIITCPHALGLAIPLVVAQSTTKSAQNGLLISNRTAFENARKITAVVFDKTGTLTEGSFEVTSVDVYDSSSRSEAAGDSMGEAAGDSRSEAAGDSMGGAEDRTSEKSDGEKEMLAIATALEGGSEHPIAKGIVSYASHKGVHISSAENFQALKGRGVSGTVSGKDVKVLSPGYLREKNLSVPEGAEKQGGVTRVFVIVDDDLRGSIALSDTIRPESYQAVRALQKRGIKCWMLTGDNQETAGAVSDQLGMDGFFAEVLPDQKQGKIKELQNQGEFVAMTGDGVNDSPALAQAQVGIAVGSGTDVAASSADIILVNSNPLDITSLILFGRATYRKMVQNLIWATGYNVVAIPLAAGVLYGTGFILSPEAGAILMSISTVVVAINARLLRVNREELQVSTVSASRNDSR